MMEKRGIKMRCPYPDPLTMAVNGAYKLVTSQVPAAYNPNNQDNIEVVGTFYVEYHSKNVSRWTFHGSFKVACAFEASAAHF